jgi:hypothetical protein
MFSQVSMDNSSIERCDSSSSGGAVDLDNLATLVARNSVIRDAFSPDGGCLQARMGSAIRLERGMEVSLCAAENRGGAVSLANAASLHTEGATLGQSQVLRGRQQCELPPCGGGGIFATDQAVVVLGAGTRVADNQADIGGGLLLAASATGTIQGAELASNSAVQGAGIASVNRSKLTLRGAALTHNRASAEGGGLYVTAEAVDFEGVTRVEGNMALRGGGVFTYVQLNMREDGDTLLADNKADAIGGGLNAEGAKAIVEVQGGHRIHLDRNEAGQHGGGMAMSFGAAVAVVEEVCSSGCSASIRGDGLCDPQCMTPACAWDGESCLCPPSPRCWLPLFSLVLLVA